MGVAEGPNLGSVLVDAMLEVILAVDLDTPAEEAPSPAADDMLVVKLEGAAEGAALPWSADDEAASRRW